MLHEKLRELRKKKGFTLKQVAADTGLSTSFLSQLETNKADPAISTLQKLADYYGVPIVHFFDTEFGENIMVKKGNRRLSLGSKDEPQIVYEMLQNTIKDKRMQATYITLSKEIDKFWTPHPGEEFMIVVKGILCFEYEDKVYELHPGDSIYYDAWKPTRFTNPHQTEIEVITVCSPPLV